MTPSELRKVREDLGYTKPVMAELIGLSLRGYEEIEAGRSELRLIHANATVGMLLNHYADRKGRMPQFFEALLISAAAKFKDDHA